MEHYANIPRSVIATGGTSLLQYHGTDESRAKRILQSGFDPSASQRTHNFPDPVVFTADSPEVAKLYGPVVIEVTVDKKAKIKKVGMLELFVRGKKLEESLIQRIKEWRGQGLQMVRVPDQQSGVGNIVLDESILLSPRVYKGN